MLWPNWHKNILSCVFFRTLNIHGMTLCSCMSGNGMKRGDIVNMEHNEENNIKLSVKASDRK